MQECRKRAIDVYRRRQKERGMMQVHPYVPVEFRTKLLQFAKDLRDLRRDNGKG